LGLGYIRLRQGFAGDALRHYSNALRLDPYSAAAYNGLGAAMVKIGKNQEAITYFRKALQLDPEDTSARKNLNNTLAAEKKLQMVE
jgi:superkiller protein 3